MALDGFWSDSGGVFELELRNAGHSLSRKLKCAVIGA
jgi:hypothetical protein